MNLNILAQDPERIEMLEKPYRDFKSFYAGKRSFLYQIAWMAKHQFRRYYFAAVPNWRIVLRSRSWRERAVPDFASLGAVRSGTSAISSYLLQHPCVVLPIAKEPPFALAKSRVLASFPREKAMKRVRDRHGVAVTGYCAPIAPSMWWIPFAKAVNQNVKILIVLRDPVERAFSHWRWDRMVTAGLRNDPLWSHFPAFDQIVDMDIKSFEAGAASFRAFSGTGGGYLTDGIYLPFIKALFANFPSSQIKVVNATEFFNNPVDVARTLYEFLGLPAYVPAKVNETNAGPSYVLSDMTRARLVRFFTPHNQKLYEYLDRDFGWVGTEKK